MIFMAIVLFFLIGVVAIYALIQTGKNYAIQLLLIPLLLVGTIFAAYSIYILQGTPKNGIPDGEVEIVFVEMQKPWIIFLSRTKGEDENPIPTYYRIPYNDENKKTMNKIMQEMESGRQVEGEFKERNKVKGGTEPPNGEFWFDRIRRDGLPPKEVAPNDWNSPILDMNGVDKSIQQRLIERGDYDILSTPPTSPISQPENYLQRYSQEDLSAFDPKYDYNHAY